MNSEARWERSPVEMNPYQRMIPDKTHPVRPRERAIPSIRKMFILSGYARAGVDPNKQIVSISTQSNKAEQFSVSSVEGRRSTKLKE
jgi:hypothetical protein